VLHACHLRTANVPVTIIILADPKTLSKKEQ
jgi:hypothetical protein